MIEPGRLVAVGVGTIVLLTVQLACAIEDRSTPVQGRLISESVSSSYDNLKQISAEASAIATGSITAYLGFQEMHLIGPSGDRGPSGRGHDVYEFTVETVLATSEHLEHPIDEGRAVRVTMAAGTPDLAQSDPDAHESLRRFSGSFDVGDHLLLYLSDFELPDGKTGFGVISSNYGAMDISSGHAVSRAPTESLNGLAIAVDDRARLALDAIGRNDYRLGNDFTTVPDPPKAFPVEPPTDATALRIHPVVDHRGGSAVGFATGSLEPNTAYVAGLCSSDVVQRGVERCDDSTRVAVTSDDEGNLTGSLTVRQLLQLGDGETLDCSAHRACRVAVARTDDLTGLRTAPLDVVP